MGFPTFIRHLYIESGRRSHLPTHASRAWKLQLYTCQLRNAQTLGCLPQIYLEVPVQALHIYMIWSRVNFLTNPHKWTARRCSFLLSICEKIHSLSLLRAREGKTGPVFPSLARSKLRLCLANHRAGYFSNLACDWLSIAWAYSEQETENGPWFCSYDAKPVYKTRAPPWPDV